MRRKLVDHSQIPWLNLFIAACALFVSLASVYVAVRETRTQEQMLTAGTWPHLAIRSGNIFDGVSEIRLSMVNSGVGPARLESLEMRMDDQPIGNAMDLLDECCGVASLNIEKEEDFVWQVGLLVTDDIDQVLIPAGEEVIFLRFAREGSNPEIFSTLDKARRLLETRACYCSVLEACWLINFRETKPVSVASCEASERAVYR